MRNLAIWAWVVLIMILGGGFYGFYILAAAGGIMLLVGAVYLIREYIEERKPSTEEQDYSVLELFADLGERGEYEKEREAYVRKWGRDPGAFDEFRERLKREGYRP